MKASIFARRGPCIASWKKTAPRASAAINSFIRNIRSRSCWPPRPINFGVGTSPSCAAPAKWTYFYLYVILDVFSRYVVGWMVAPRESAELARKLIEETCEKQNIQPGQLGLHADRGSAMRSKPVALLLADLSVTKTHSRPYTSNDNPYSESQFRTMKYRPEFPDRFGCIQDSRAFCQTFFPWYNDEHRHSGIGMMSPAMVHHGAAAAVRENRQRFSMPPIAAHPERFVRRPPAPPQLPKEVWINKPLNSDEETH